MIRNTWMLLILMLVRPLAIEADEPTLAEIRHPKNVGFPPVGDAQVKGYTARRTKAPLRVDGRLDEPSWRRAPASTPFVDLVSGNKTMHDTRVKLLWDDRFLYVGYEIEEPNVRAKFLQRDKPIWQDNDVELFLGFDHAYYELEINAHGTLYEGLFVWQSSYRRHGFAEVPEIDIAGNGVRHQPFNGVGYKKHPRGPRWAFLDWDFPKLQSAVHIDGTLNDDGDRDRGWTVELAVPWSGMKTLALGDRRAIPPRDGDQWRMDFSRFNQYREPPPARDSGGWALSHHGIWDSHIPEVFAKVKFSTSEIP